MPKATQTPATALKSLMDEYQENPFSLAKKVGLSTSAVRQISIGESGITVPTALRLAKFFGQCPSFWLDMQLQVEMDAAASNKELQGILKGIKKAVKPSAAAKEKAPAKAQAKPGKKVTLADKRKEGAKASGSKASQRKIASKKVK